MKKVLLPFILILLLVLIYLGYTNYPKLNILTGFAAKNVCSCVFEADRDLKSIEAGDNDFAPVSYASNTIKAEENQVASTILGLKKRKAMYVEGAGCTLLPENTSSPANVEQPNRIKFPANFAYPYGGDPPVDTLFSNIDYKKLKLAVDDAFDRVGEESKRSRAVVVIYRDHLIAENYAPEFSKDTKLLGWSMTKSITSAVLGVLEKQGRISPSQDHLFPEWENDVRANITLDNLLQMNSGLEWEEDYGEISDVTKMLFLEESMPRVQLHKPLVGEPGQTWNYSSGTTNLLSKFIRDQFDTHQEYLDFWYKELIDKIGMHSMTVEMDYSGHYVGSSYAWATARDWAKFGVLYLRKGNWKGEQLIKESWVDYTATPTNGSNGEYGAHFWLNAGGKYPNVPKDLFSSNGFQGQHVFIIPSRDVVIVRFGLTEHPVFDVDSFLKNILAAIE